MAEVERLRDAGRLEEALQVAVQAQERFPERADITWLHVAENQRRLGRTEAALATIEDAVERRALWRVWTLIAPLPYFDGLREEPRYRAAVAEVQRRIRELAPRPLTLIQPPPAPTGSPPLLLALHGANGNADEIKGWFEGAPGLGWLLALGQSSQPVSEDGRFCWDNPDLVAADLEAIVAEVRASQGFDPDRVVLAGFSQGGVVAVRAFLQRGPLPSRGYLVVCPSFARQLPLETVPADNAGGVMLVGSQDPWRKGAEAMHEALLVAGVASTLEILDGLGHVFPPDFGTRLPGLLARLA